MSMVAAIKSFFVCGWHIFNRTLIFLTPMGDLFIRYWVAKIFFVSALTKIQSWETTMMLFTYEYEVPFLSDTVEAYSGTAVELIVPIFLLLGLGGRVPAFILFFFNLTAIIAYPFLHTEAGYVGLVNHVYWGMLLLVTMLHGPGKLSLDELIKWWWLRR